MRAGEAVGIRRAGRQGDGEKRFIMKIGIVGYGVVGRALSKLFGEEDGTPDAHVYDKFVRGLNTAERKSAIQACDLVFVAVPTPEGPAKIMAWGRRSCSIARFRISTTPLFPKKLSKLSGRFILCQSTDQAAAQSGKKPDPECPLP